MGLTTEQKAELERLGAATVRMKLVQPGAGAGAALAGFKSGFITRSDVEEWLSEQNAKEDRRQNATLRWARIAGWAAIAAVALAIVGMVLQK
jgi:CHASE3 domain sensor protein